MKQRGYRPASAVEFHGSAHGQCRIIGIPPAAIPPKLPQSFAINIANFIANHLATRPCDKRPASPEIQCGPDAAYDPSYLRPLL